jgi:hypothetical protein
MCCVRHYLPMLQEKKDIPVQFIYSFSLIFPLPWWLLLQTSWQMVSAQAYLDLQESFLVVISLLGSLLLKIVKAQAYLDLHGIRRSHRTSLNMLLLRKMIQDDGQWWQVDSRVAVPYVQTNIMSTVSDPQQVRSISKSTISPTFLQHFSNIWGRTVRSLAPCGHHPVPATPKHALRTGRNWWNRASLAQKGTRCAAMPTVWWSCHCVVDAEVAVTDCMEHQNYSNGHICNGHIMINVVDEECWGCWMMFNDV